MQRWFLVLMLTLTACADPNAQPDYPPPEQVTGLITEITYVESRIVAFDVETRMGATVDVLIDPDRDYGFNLKHLEEHERDELPVSVDLEAKGERLYAVEIADA